MIQTEWVKPADQLVFRCQLTTQQHMVVNITVTHDELLHYTKDSLMKKKKEQAKLSFMDLISREFDKHFKGLVSPPSMEVKK